LTLWQIDIVDMRQCPDGDYNYICHVEDHFTKFHILFPLRSNSAQEVAIGLEQRVLAYFGPPRILHTDSGPEFSNALLQTLYRQWNADITFLKVGYLFTLCTSSTVSFTRICLLVTVVRLLVSRQFPAQLAELFI